ncbi:bifunctional DNA-formamidopyrimidine glycosylase/DNA-(apurinic or apyrimidinic site) lyase [Geomonas sp. RF6]|uniref:bifunctional DNA-formamidopyrimidine glycosylase/DNA-(apurinic or apyrimidinic site) lyase n=1 Tax=Geomonas sp. RF6 TaxID=2897342 RepID=UPI001E31D361|nr:bifunctional DNA-formamidopyrimidine glycosylase/DNA-(apurinic or apyrimidinic site) lyase [Geomonas sp. RF6]UFS70017.1 bifunctional DNA-formamidopyrimidine glycosylase/DNA-(apurinic or apyrimidinic site) lyase [Geomonas sp. RF6]
MPELPEVEVTRLGIRHHVVGNAIQEISIHSPKLRSFVPPDLSDTLAGESVLALERRGKYLVFSFARGALLLHLGMTGHLRLVNGDRTPGKHDHVDILLSSGMKLRLNDVRLFGRVHWTASNPLQHPLLACIGPEPLTDGFTGAYLFGRTRRRRVAIQRFIMDAAVVAGVGNIYAAESLFASGILPTTIAADLSEAQCHTVVQKIKEVLATSIAVGSATMDFCAEEERLAYFPQELNVYDREGEPCRVCEDIIQRGRLGNRSTFFCGRCQK